MHFEQEHRATGPRYSKRHFEQALALTGGNVRSAGRILGWHRRESVYDMIKKFDLEPLVEHLRAARAETRLQQARKEIGTSWLKQPSKRSSNHSAAEVRRRLKRSSEAA